MYFTIRGKYAEQEFGTGSVPDPRDDRDYPEPVGVGLFDWTKGYDVEAELSLMHNKTFHLPVHHQDGSLSCVGQAWTTYGSVKNYVEMAEWTKASARDMYSHIFLASGGSYIRRGGQRYTGTGVLPEKEWPSYDQGNPPSESFMRKRIRKSEVYDNLRYVMKGKEYRRVSFSSIDDIAKAISLNHGVVLGVKGDNNGTWYSEFPKPPTKAVWGHALYFGRAKLIHGDKYIGACNSWGEQVGDDGWQWFGEDWLRYMFDVWTLSDEKNQMEREADYEKMKAFTVSDEYKKNRPKPSHSIYHSENWDYIQKSTGLEDITWGMFYDYFQAKKLRQKYEI